MTNESEHQTLKPGYSNFSELCVCKKKYANLKRLDKGDMKGAEWKVYKYEDPDDKNQSIAYKKLSSLSFPRKIGYDAFYQALIREFDISNRAKHPCTIELLSFDLSDLNDPIIVTRFYEKKIIKT